MPKIQVDKIDPEEADFPTRRRSRAPSPSRDRQADAAYEFVRLFVDLKTPIAPVDQSAFGSPHHPPWAVRRAFLRLVSEGVLRLGELPKRDERGRMIWHRYVVPTPATGRVGAARDGNSVVWAEGAWRLTYFSMSPRSIVARANEPRKMARRRNREAAEKHEFETARTRGRGVFNGVCPVRLRTVEVPAPSLSMRARIRQFFRGIKGIDWDGMAFIPVPGPALDAVLEWRASLPAAPSPGAVLPRPFKEDVLKTCWRCGASFSPAFWKNKRSHALKECNMFLVTRIIEE